MARYRLNAEGVHDTMTGADITPANYLEWLEYQAWLAAGNVPDPMVTFDPFATLAAQRTEALARLFQLRIHHSQRGTVVALGHNWRVTTEFVVVMLLHRTAFPPFPAGFSLPDADGVQVALNNAQLSALVTAFAARAVAVNAVYAALRAAVVASAAPLTVPLVGWPA